MYHNFKKKVTPEIVEQENREFWQRVENGKVTILKCSPLEFNLRWFGMGFTAATFGLALGFILRGLV